MDPLHSIESGPDYENDEVIRELDVYVNDKLELYLLQFPLKPCYIHPPPEFKSAKYKPENRKLELDGGASMPCMVSSTLPNTTQIDILQLRPSFEAFQKNFDFIVDDEDEEDLVNRNKTGSVSNKVAASGSILQQVQIKRKETERSQNFRRKSYAQFKAKEESEAWKALQVHNIDSLETIEIFEELYYKV